MALEACTKLFACGGELVLVGNSPGATGRSQTSAVYLRKVETGIGVVKRETKPRTADDS